MSMLDNSPAAVRETYLRMKNERGKKLELKIRGGKYYLYMAKGVWDRKKKKPVKKTTLFGSIDEDGTFREKKPRRIFSSSMVYEYGNSQLVWNLMQKLMQLLLQWQ